MEESSTDIVDAVTGAGDLIRIETGSMNGSLLWTVWQGQQLVLQTTSPRTARSAAQNGGLGWTARL